MLGKGANPFAVKLRKTKTTPVAPKPVAPEPLSPAMLSPRGKETIDAGRTPRSYSHGSTTPTDTPPLARSNVYSGGVEPRRWSDRLPPREPKQVAAVIPNENPFLSQVKLRKTGGIKVAAPMAGGDSRENEEGDAAKARGVDNKADVQEGGQQQQQQQKVEGSVKKMSYREQQNLLKAQQQQQQRQAEQEEREKEPPAKDVATLIRERIAAANRQRNSQPTARSNVSGNGNIGGNDGVVANFDSLRGNLKKTSTTAALAIQQCSPPGSPSAARPQHFPPSSPMDSSPAFEKVSSMVMPKTNNDRHLAQNQTPTNDHRAEVMQEDQEETKEDEDPRAALMAMLSKRRSNASLLQSPQGGEEERPTSSDTTPRTMPATAATVNPGAKPAAVPHSHTAPSQSTPPQSIYNGGHRKPRIPGDGYGSQPQLPPVDGGGSTEPQGSSDPRQSLAAMLARRASPVAASSITAAGNAPASASRLAAAHDGRASPCATMGKAATPASTDQGVLLAAASPGGADSAGRLALKDDPE